MNLHYGSHTKINIRESAFEKPNSLSGLTLCFLRKKVNRILFLSPLYFIYQQFELVERT